MRECNYSVCIDTDHKQEVIVCCLLATVKDIQLSNLVLIVWKRNVNILWCYQYSGKVHSDQLFRSGTKQYKLHAFLSEIPCGLVVRIRRSHRRGRGSIPRMGDHNFFAFSFCSVLFHHIARHYFLFPSTIDIHFYFPFLKYYSEASNHFEMKNKWTLFTLYGWNARHLVGPILWPMNPSWQRMLLSISSVSMLQMRMACWGDALQEKTVAMVFHFVLVPSSLAQ